MIKLLLLPNNDNLLYFSNLTNKNLIEVLMALPATEGMGTAPLNLL